MTHSSKATARLSREVSIYIFAPWGKTLLLFGLLFLAQFSKVQSFEFLLLTLSFCITYQEILVIFRARKCILDT